MDKLNEFRLVQLLNGLHEYKPSKSYNNKLCNHNLYTSFSFTLIPGHKIDKKRTSSYQYNSVHRQEIQAYRNKHVSQLCSYTWHWCDKVTRTQHIHQHLKKKGISKDIGQFQWSGCRTAQRCGVFYLFPLSSLAFCICIFCILHFFFVVSILHFAFASISCPFAITFT